MKYLIVCLLFVVILTGCGGRNSNTSGQKQEQEQTEYIEEIPAPYFSRAMNRGQIITEIYRSRDYTSGDAAEITKTA